jgi:hypothetical protein
MTVTTHFRVLCPGTRGDYRKALTVLTSGALNFPFTFTYHTEIYASPLVSYLLYLCKVHD